MQSFQQSNEKLLARSVLLSEGDSTRSQSLAGTSGFYNRSEIFRRQKELRRQRRKEVLRREETKECSFHPTINQLQRSTQSLRSEANGNFGERLHNDERRLKKIEQLSLAREQKEAEELNIRCTYKPAIYSTQGKSRYLQTHNELSNLQHGPSVHHAHNPEEPQCTFQPSINKGRSWNKEAKNRRHEETFVRLSQPKTRAEQVEKPQRSSEPGPKLSRGLSCTSCVLSEFYQRQLEFEQRKEDKKHRVLEETYVVPVPTINKKSSEIAQQLVSFEERNEVFLNRKENHMSKTVWDQFPQDYTFHPRILPQSKGRKGKNAEELSYGPLVQKELRLRQIKESLVQQETSTCTFKPQTRETKKYAEVRSRLQLQKSVETYVDYLSRQEQCKAQLGKWYQQQKVSREMAECTHKPQTNPLPDYLKKSGAEGTYPAAKTRPENPPSYSKIHSKLK